MEANENIINVMSFDPGNNLGVSIYTLDAYNLKIISIETKQFVLNNSIESDDDMKTLFRLNALSLIIKNLILTYNPLAVALETSFLNMRFPKAVIQLSQYVSTIEMTAYNINPYLVFFRYMPKYIKRLIGAGGNADKDDMTKAINNIENIKNNIDISKLTEHEVDSLAIGYIAVTEIQKHPFILYKI